VIKILKKYHILIQKLKGIKLIVKRYYLQILILHMDFILFNNFPIEIQFIDDILIFKHFRGLDRFIMFIN